MTFPNVFTKIKLSVIMTFIRYFVTICCVNKNLCSKPIRCKMFSLTSAVGICNYFLNLLGDNIGSTPVERLDVSSIFYILVENEILVIT